MRAMGGAKAMDDEATGDPGEGDGRRRESLLSVGDNSIPRANAPRLEAIRYKQLIRYDLRQNTEKRR